MIEHFFSGHSVYAYLGVKELRAIAARHGVAIRHKPIDLDQVMSGARSSAFEARPLQKLNYFYVREVERWAHRRGLPILTEYPPSHFQSPELATRAILASAALGLDTSAVVEAFLSAHWEQGADPSSASDLSAVLNALGLDAAAILDRAAQPESALALERCTTEAIEKGVLGSPTYAVGGDLFYGQDRLDFVEAALTAPFPSRFKPITAVPTPD